MIAATLMLLQAAACTPAATAAATPPGWRAARAADGGTLAPGRAATVALRPDARFATPPEKAPAAGTRGASVDFVVARAGRWRVSLDSGAWIDVTRNGRPVAAAAHGHGAPCSGVRKQVEFDLAAGRYVLQLSGAAAASVRVMVAPA